MKIEDLKKEIDGIIEKHYSRNENGGVKIYTDYCERELSRETLKEIFSSDNPRIAFNELITEWTEQASECNLDYLFGIIERELSEEAKVVYEKYVSEIEEYILDKVYFYYDAQDFNNKINVNILVDNGNGNYSYSCDNILNYCGNGNIDENSSILWLAKKQNKETEFRAAVKKYDSDIEETWRTGDKFIDSAIQELENLASEIGTVTFLVKMELFQTFDLLEMQKEKKEASIIIKKETMCGLFDSIFGGGSMLEIELDKDVELSLSDAVFCVEKCNMNGYDVDEVYSLCDCWKEIKEIKTK